MAEYQLNNSIIVTYKPLENLIILNSFPGGFDFSSQKEEFFNILQNEVPKKSLVRFRVSFMFNNFVFCKGVQSFSQRVTKKKDMISKFKSEIKNRNNSKTQNIIR